MNITFSQDINGNKTIDYKPARGIRSFSVQTNGNCPSAHRMSKEMARDYQRHLYLELYNYIKEHGTKNQLNKMELM